MDNLSVHHCDHVLLLIQDSGNVVNILPPYSLDLNPVEEAFSYIKSYLKLHEDVVDAINDPIPLFNAAINSITINKCKNWIAHSGYVTE